MTASPSRAFDLTGIRICLVTSAPVGSNPRLVKEADALHGAGAQVRVVAADATNLAVVRERNEHVLRGVLWSFEAVPVGRSVARRIRAAVRRSAHAFWAVGFRTLAVAERGLEPLIGPIARTAARNPADLYIAHNLAALPAAAAAARRHGAQLGFDAEDFHSGQLGPDDRPMRDITRRVEREYVPRCTHLTAASPGIAAEYARLCAVPTPTTVLNVFPRAMAPEAPTQTGERDEGPSLYWFSQTIGPGRGLEQVIAALGYTRSRPRLVLQGSLSEDYRQSLKRCAQTHGVADRVRFLSPAPPSELARICARHDLGLATEVADCTNHDVCLSNKIFTYPLAGVPVLASSTSAQAALAAQWPEWLWALELSDTRGWAEQIDALLLSPARLAHARAAAWRAGQERLNWECESRIFLGAVAAALGRA